MTGGSPGLVDRQLTNDCTFMMKMLEVAQMRVTRALPEHLVKVGHGPVAHLHGLPSHPKTWGQPEDFVSPLKNRYTIALGGEHTPTERCLWCPIPEPRPLKEAGGLLDRGFSHRSLA